MKFINPYFTNQDKIELLQRWILVHSHIYYFCNTNVVSDHMFDMNCKQLVKMQEKYRKSWKQSTYYYAMKDFEGSTGAGFVEKLANDHFLKVVRDANMVIDRYGRNK